MPLLPRSGVARLPALQALVPSALLAAAAVVSLTLVAAPARAQIVYEYNTVLSLSGGTDTLGFNGASALVRFLVPAGATYVNRFGVPAVVVSDATVTFTGASVAANNGTFSLGATVFYPKFAGFFKEPSGNPITVTFQGGGTLDLYGRTVPTASSSAVQIGDLALATHFGPTTNNPAYGWYSSIGTIYNLNNTVITATAAPEPGELAIVGMLGTSVCGLMVRARRKAGISNRN